MKYVNGFLTLILASAGLYFWIVLYSWWRVWRGERLTENFVKYMRYAFFTYVVVLVMFGGLRYLEDVQPASETISAKPKERKLSFVAKAVMTLKSEKAFLTGISVDWILTMNEFDAVIKKRNQLLNH